ncbi:protein N-terminal glutamine amidohydrolase [Aplysia californica]|uniref:Protein N-terminal glutamine amidohydrolase n=1 Tax=Aplysia californica TaxID=6500 RepID=A0ABM0K8N3_APLCA|nr:protein N-terminal glutamine amidohydrolase [Aplysia californica]XP_035829078.1 protein N-terminal glutamine amidohydrolase [Aplysia californica]XP_035829079.1 protein N-terminal glutamine amidohydrolase [Aplysia californica]
MSIEENKVTSVVPSEREQCTYTACYCEENVWKLCALVKDSCPEEEFNKCSCVFISNDKRQIPLWHQRAGKNPERLVVWDYHVIMVYNEKESPLVYDLDTELSFPCHLKEYAAAGIGDEKSMHSKYKRMFRVIPGQEFLSTFASDRSHMLDKEGGWMSPPPDYPPIKTEASSNNIQEFISMDKSVKHGQVYNLSGFLHKFDTSLS